MSNLFGALIAAVIVFITVSFSYGLYLCFAASVLVGAVSLVFFPLATITGAIPLLSGNNLAEEIVKLLRL